MSGLLFGSLLGPGMAAAQEGRARPNARKIDTIRPEGHLNLGGFRGTFGVGFRVDIPVFREGWLRSPDITDEFAISAGADLMFIEVNGRDLDLGFWPVVVAQWNLHFNEEWSLFPELGMALLIGDDHYHADGPDTIDLTIAASIGLRWHFGDRNALLMRINHPTGFQLGLTF